MIDYESKYADAIAGHISEGLRSPHIDIVSVLSSLRLSEICFSLGDGDIQFMEVAIRYASIAEYMGRLIFPSGCLVTSNDGAIFNI